jgi:hypothetical protein
LDIFVFWFKKECFGANPSFKYYRCAFFLSSFCIVFRRSIGCSGSALEAVDLKIVAEQSAIRTSRTLWNEARMYMRLNVYLDVSFLDIELLDDEVADFDTLVPLELNDLA